MSPVDVVAAAVGVALPPTAMGLGEAIVLGALLGCVWRLSASSPSGVFYAHAETHLDPPEARIVVTSLGLTLLAIAGVLSSSAWILRPRRARRVSAMRPSLQIGAEARPTYE